MGDADDRLLTEAFADFHSEFAPGVKPAGTAAAHSTVRRRRRARVIATSALVALAIAAPVVAYAATGGDPHGPPPLIGGSPSATPSTQPAPTPTATTTPPAVPVGQISRADLRKAQLTIPAWPGETATQCLTGPVKFTDGKAGRNGLLEMRGDPAYVDVDHDGTQETVVLVACSPQGVDYQVLALQRGPNRRIDTLGKVVGSAGLPGKRGSDIMTIWGVEAGDNGQIRVDVGEYRPCCAEAQASQHQWRTYGWNGDRFTQTGGPTKFGPNPKVTDLVIVTARRLTMTKQGDGSWAGTLRVTVRNDAAFAMPGRLKLGLDIDQTWQWQAGQECPFEPGRDCMLPGLAAGADRVFTVAVKAPPGALKTRDVSVRANAVDDGYGYSGYPDRKPHVWVTVQVVQG